MKLKSLKVFAYLLNPVKDFEIRKKLCVRRENM